MFGFLGSLDKVWNVQQIELKTENEPLRIDYAKFYLNQTIVIGSEGILAKRIDSIYPKIRQLNTDINPLFRKKAYCGQNTEAILNALQHFDTKNPEVGIYDLSGIVLVPGPRRIYHEFIAAPGYSFDLEDRINGSHEALIKQREDLWGVGTTMGVTYHALPLFNWPAENLYISVETTLCGKWYKLQYHITETPQAMLDLLRARYLASRIEFYEHLVTAAIFEITERRKDPLTPLEKNASYRYWIDKALTAATPRTSRYGTRSQKKYFRPLSGIETSRRSRLSPYMLKEMKLPSKTPKSRKTKTQRYLSTLLPRSNTRRNRRV